MSLLNKIGGWFFLLAVALVSPQIIAQTSDHKNQTDVPELPPEESATVAAPQTEEQQSERTVINYDENKTAFSFFNDSGVTKGASRYLNFLDISGYFRTRFAFFHNAHLGTYIPNYGGTSNFAPNASFLNRRDTDEESKRNPSQNNFSANMRLRLDPTINVTEVARIRTTVDVFDNMVLGSIPGYLTQGVPSLNATYANTNSLNSAIALKRAWAEVSFPIGELRFGRMPMHWGLGILYNSGDGINSDYGDQVDGIFFSTRIFDHFLTPGYSIAYTGPSHRGGGLFARPQDFQSAYLSHESGQRYPMDTSDMAHVLSLSFLKRDSEFIVNKKREEGRAIYNYGIFASYRHQYLDSQGYALAPTTNTKDFLGRLVRRNSNLGTASIWQSFSIGTFHLELEAAGIWGKYTIGDTQNDEMAKLQKPKRSADGSLARDENGNVQMETVVEKERDVWVLQGGIALQSRYGFLNDRLQVGLDGGFASYQEGPGFGLRENGSGVAEEGGLDGRKLPASGGYKTNFRFNPAYTVDMLMYKEVLGGIGSTFYLKPHISYFFSRNLGLRGDVISSFAPNKENTTGNSNFLGVELDASAFLRTDNGFYFQLAYGVLFPLKGLDRQKVPDITENDFKVFGDAQIAQTVQAYVGIVF